MRAVEQKKRAQEGWEEELTVYSIQVATHDSITKHGFYENTTAIRAMHECGRPTADSGSPKVS